MGVMKVYAKVEKIEVDENKRIICISDIHGNLDALKGLLDLLKFSKEDILVLLGDLVEKGPKNLETLRYIIDLTHEYEVYVVCGNCDAITKEIMNPEENHRLLSYLLLGCNSLLNEMLDEINVHLHSDSDLCIIKDLLLTNFPEELNFIMNLPDIIETKSFIFVHGGLTDSPLERQEQNRVRRMEEFLNHGTNFNKYVIVGHWPVALYSRKYPNYNPIVCKDKKIISIDGGNIVTPDGQLNAFIIPNMNSEEFYYQSYDNLNAATAIYNQDENVDSIYIPWTNNHILLLEKEEEFTYCKHIPTGQCMWILNKFIYSDASGFHCEDSTNYQLPIKAFDRVKVVEETSRGYYVKKNGICGWYYGKLKFD